MCKFFSFLCDGFGNYKYLDWEVRRKWREEKSDNSPDSHTCILTHYKVPPKMQDRLSKYEFNPITKKFVVDEGIMGHDHASAEAWVNMLNFKTIIPALIIKPIFNPLFKIQKVTAEDIALLREWVSVQDSVRDSVWNSVWNSVWDSVRDSVWAYISSFFDIKYKYDFSSCIQLWEKGFVPVFDGSKWHLCSGKNAKIVYTWDKSKE